MIYIRGFVLFGKNFKISFSMKSSINENDYNLIMNKVYFGWFRRSENIH